MAREMDAAGAVVGKHVSEQLGVAVEEVFSVRRVVKVVALVGAEQRHRELVEHVTPRLEHLTGNVDANSVTSGAGRGGGGALSVQASFLQVGRKRTGGDRNPADRRGANKWKPRCHRRHDRGWLVVFYFRLVA